MLRVDGPTRDDLLRELMQHQGRMDGVTGAALSRRLGIPERRIRIWISQLRNEGTAVCGHPTSGYYIAVTPAELESCCQFLRARAMHSLHLESRLRRIPLQDLIGQLHVPT